MLANVNTTENRRRTLVTPFLISSVLALLLLFLLMQVAVVVAGAGAARDNPPGSNADRQPAVVTKRVGAPATVLPTSTPGGCNLDVNFVFTQSTGAVIVPGTTDTGNHCEMCVTAITL